MTDIDVPLGQLTPGDPPRLDYVRTLRHPVEKVWRAVTERDHLHAWLPVDIVGERREGAELQLPFWPEVTEAMGFEDPGHTGQIRVWDPPRVFEWTWDRDVVRIELEEQGHGTLLRLTTWVVDLTAGIDRTGAGYHVCLDHLARLLDTGEDRCVITTDTSALEIAYADAFGMQRSTGPVAG